MNSFSFPNSSPRREDDQNWFETYVIQIPDGLISTKELRGQNQRKAVAYFMFRMRHNPNWRFHAVELSKVLGITPDGARKMLVGFIKKGVVRDCGLKRMMVEPETIKATISGLVYYDVHEFTGIASAINALAATKSNQLDETATLRWNELEEEKKSATFERREQLENCQLLLEGRMDELNRRDRIWDMKLDATVALLRHSLDFYGEKLPNIKSCEIGETMVESRQP